jgi:hypothetical protein
MTTFQCCQFLTDRYCNPKFKQKFQLCGVRAGSSLLGNIARGGMLANVQCLVGDCGGLAAVEFSVGGVAVRFGVAT